MAKELTFVQTCGLCEQICKKQDVGTHPCLRGYPAYHTDPKTYYFFPLCDDGVTIVRKSRLENGDEVRVAEEKNQAETGVKFLVKTKDQMRKLNFDQEEVLISEVQKREHLWNYKIAIQERDKVTIQRLWTEVAKELKGALTADGARKKFKSLHDVYRKIIRSEKYISGSAKRPSVQKWHHYDSMEFLRHHCGVKDTASNCTDQDEDSSNGSDANEHSAKGPIDKKRKKQTDDNSAINRIADALIRPARDIVLPPAPVPDEIDSCVSLIACQLRRVPASRQPDAVRKMIETSYQILEKYHD